MNLRTYEIARQDLVEEIWGLNNRVLRYITEDMDVQSIRLARSRREKVEDELIDLDAEARGLDLIE